MADRNVVRKGEPRPAKHDGGKERRETFHLIPPVDIYETDDRLVVVADMPGVEKDALKINVNEGVLTFEGMPFYQMPHNLDFQEFTLSRYWRQFELGEDIDQQKINATLKHGVLTIDLPKAERAKARMIEIHEA